MRFEIPAAGGRQEMVIEAPAVANINYFLKTALVPVTSASATTAQVAVKGYQRRSFPGDTVTTAVSASSREYLKDAGRKSGNALGGYTFTLVADAGLPGEEKRSFTLVKGRMVDLHAFLVGQAKYQVHLYGKSGARYVIDAATTLANP
jgi:hypothetical protein